MNIVKVGEVELRRVEELAGPSRPPEALLPGFDPSLLKSHPHLMDERYMDAASGSMVSSIHSWVFRIGKDVVIVDTGAGNDKERVPPANTRFHHLNLPWLDRLKAAGFAADDVTLVINTHLHADHVGWNTTLRGGEWVPTFPNSRYIVGKVELDHWLSPTGGQALFPANVATIEDSVLPILDRGLYQTVEDGQDILPGLRAIAAPGHTKGQMAIELRSAGQAAVFTADVFHHPIQIADPRLNTKFCELPETAIETRRNLLTRAADTGAILLPSHLGSPHACRIARRGMGFSFSPLQLVGA